MDGILWDKVNLTTGTYTIYRVDKSKWTKYSDKRARTALVSNKQILQKDVEQKGKAVGSKMEVLSTQLQRIIEAVEADAEEKVNEK